MISLPDREAMLHALSTPLPPDLRLILADIVTQAAQHGLLDLTYIIVVEPGDTLDAVTEELGYCPLTNPLDGQRYDQDGFDPYWASIQRRGEWYVRVDPIADSGFAFAVIVHQLSDTDLVALCERHTMVPF